MARQRAAGPRAGRILSSEFRSVLSIAQRPSHTPIFSRGTSPNQTDRPLDWLPHGDEQAGLVTSAAVGTAGISPRRRSPLLLARSCEGRQRVHDAEADRLCKDGC